MDTEILNGMDRPHRQIGALPYRLTAAGEVEVLLVTSRRTKRWIVPKGWPMTDMSDPDAAAREAYEEAGVIGQVAHRSIGEFTYEKALKTTGLPALFCVTVYPMRIERQLAFWPEANERLTTWVVSHEAVNLVAIPELSEIIGVFCCRPGRKGPSEKAGKRILKTVW